MHKIYFKFDEAPDGINITCLNINTFTWSDVLTDAPAMATELAELIIHDFIARDPGRKYIIKDHYPDADFVATFNAHGTLIATEHLTVIPSVR